jgi:hypothetical protein
MQKQNESEQKKPTLEMSLSEMEAIEDGVQQWLILEEHWTQNNLSRHQQLEYARALHKGIIDRIREAYKHCPNYSTV